MPLKFTLLGLEFSSCSPACANNNEIEKNPKMVKKKLTSHQRKFKRAVQECHSSTKSKEAFGKCLSQKLKNKKR